MGRQMNEKCFGKRYQCDRERMLHFIGGKYPAGIWFCIQCRSKLYVELRQLNYQFKTAKQAAKDAIKYGVKPVTNP